VNGVEAPLLLDTGTSQVFLSAPLARDADLYLPPSETVDAFTPGFAVPLRAGAFDTLSLGGASFGAGVALVGVREAGATKAYGGILGMSVLSHFRVTFDFRAREVRLEPHGQEGYSDPLLAPVELNGRPYMLMVDSGASRVFLEPWAARELGLLSEAREEDHARKATDPDDAHFTWVKVASVKLAGRTFEKVEAAVVNTFEGMASDDGHRPAGLLGLAGFGELRWTVDFAQREIRVHD
jgi:predicted aspartyl protease